VILHGASLFVLLHGLAPSVPAAVTTPVTTGQELADAVAAFGASGLDAQLALKPNTSNVISLADAAFKSVSEIAAAANGRTPFSSGSLVIGAQLGGDGVILVSSYMLLSGWVGRLMSLRA
jgi:hypothetical protein